MFVRFGLNGREIITGGSDGIRVWQEKKLGVKSEEGRGKSYSRFHQILRYVWRPPSFMRGRKNELAALAAFILTRSSDTFGGPRHSCGGGKTN
jgi:hypothetical protein